MTDTIVVEAPVFGVKDLRIPYKVACRYNHQEHKGKTVNIPLEVFLELDPGSESANELERCLGGLGFHCRDGLERAKAILSSHVDEEGTIAFRVFDLPTLVRPEELEPIVNHLAYAIAYNYEERKGEKQPPRLLWTQEEMRGKELEEFGYNVTVYESQLFNQAPGTTLERLLKTAKCFDLLRTRIVLLRIMQWRDERRRIFESSARRREGKTTCVALSDAAAFLSSEDP